MRVLLLAGGGGTRLWPLSTEERPKQFLPLLSEESLLAETYRRVAPLTGEIYVAAGERYVSRIRKELPGLQRSRILAEPVRRNSGPALLAAALRFEAEGDPITAAVPSDQTVADAKAFRESLAAAARAAQDASVVVLAVEPTRPEGDFGYLEIEWESGRRVGRVLRFIEKPGAAGAARHVAAGHLWNAGIFVFRPSRLLEQARRVAPQLLRRVERYAALSARGQTEAARRAYGRMPAVSIDYAVMEKADGVRAVKLSAGWSDVGTWRSVRDLRGPSDEHGNLILSDAPVLAPGVADTAIVVAREGVLVLPFARETELRGAVETLKAGPKASRDSSRAPKGRKKR